MTGIYLTQTMKHKLCTKILILTLRLVHVEIENKLPVWKKGSILWILRILWHMVFDLNIPQFHVLLRRTYSIIHTNTVDYTSLKVLWTKLEL
jgi:hypothetical protein